MTSEAERISASQWKDLNFSTEGFLFCFVFLEMSDSTQLEGSSFILLHCALCGLMTEYKLARCGAYVTWHQIFFFFFVSL